MKRDFLKNLGIEDKEIIDKILDENSADIGRAKSGNDDLKSQVTQLQTQLNDKTKEFDTLKESTKDYESLKEQITQLTTDKTNLQTELNTKVSEVQKKHAIENSVRDAKAKNVKAVMALLDMEKIKYEDGELSGISEQLETLTTGDDTKFLFEGAVNISGATPSQPNGGNNGGNGGTFKSFAEVVKQAIGENK